MRIILTFSFLFFVHTVFSQEFAPVGAQWEYCFFTPFPLSTASTILKVKKDTIINSIEYKIIDETRITKFEQPTVYDTITNQILLSVKQDSVFYLKDGQEQFIYNRKAFVGDTIHLDLGFLKIDSIKSEFLDSSGSHNLYFLSGLIGGFFEQQIISDQFGPYYDGFKFNESIQPTDWSPSVIVNYNDNTFKNIVFNEWERHCDFLSALDNDNETSFIRIYPNPNYGFLNIEFHNNDDSRIGLLISNSGQIIKKVEFSKRKNKLVADYKGIAILLITSSNTYYSSILHFK